MKKKLLFFLLVISALFLVSCGQEEKEKKTGQEISLYYLNTAEDGFETVRYILEAPSDLEKSVAEVLYALSDTEGDNTGRYKAFMKGITVQKVEVDDGNVTIDFGEDYHNISYVDEGLYRTAIVKSLVQIRGIDSVEFHVNGTDLLGSDDKPVGPMNEKSFLIEGEKDIYTMKKKVTLFYADEKGRSLERVKKKIISTSNEPIEKLALEELCHKPSGEKNRDLKSPLPEDLVINQVQILDDICYVDLGDEIMKVVPGVDEKITVYAMVHTLCSINPAYQVRFSVEGSRVSQLNNLEHFDETFLVNPRYNKKKK